MDIQITIPQLYDGTTFYKLYVYCSSDMQEIDTITKIRYMQPAIIIDESEFDRTSKYFQTVNGKECYVIPANILNQHTTLSINGVSWYKNDLNLLPVSEYETIIEVLEVNPNTYTSTVTLNNIYTSELGSMLYYSVIGVNQATNQITHLSKVAGIRTKFDLAKNVKRELYSCDNYDGDMDDVWKLVAVVNWEDSVIIGNLNNKEQYNKFGCPFVETVPTFTEEEINISLKPLNTIGCMLLSFPNPWQFNNSAYNYRKIKAFRFINVSDGVKSRPSIPTFQSSLPLTIEKVRVLVLPDAENTNSHIPYDLINDKESKVIMREIIRRNGIFYNESEHRKIGFNKFNITSNETFAIFSESSTQPNINIEIEAKIATPYKVTIYLEDLYGNISAPVTKFFYV